MLVNSMKFQPRHRRLHFTRKVAFGENARYCLKWCINLHYVNIMVKTRNSILFSNTRNMCSVKFSDWELEKNIDQKTKEAVVARRQGQPKFWEVDGLMGLVSVPVFYTRLKLCIHSSYISSFSSFR